MDQEKRNNRFMVAMSNAAATITAILVISIPGWLIQYVTKSSTLAMPVSFLLGFFCGLPLIRWIKKQ